LFVSFVRSKTPKVVSNLVEFFVFFIWRIYLFFFFFFLCLNCVFLHLICGNYLLLCLGFGSALTLIYMSMRVWGINCLICFCVELQKKKYCGSSQKETNIYWKKKVEKEGSKKKGGGSSTQLLLQFYLWFIDIYFQSVFLLESPCCLI